MRTRVMLVVSALVLTVALTGCYSAPGPVAVETQGSAAATAAASWHSDSQSGAGLALGADLQRTADWKLGGKLWAMSLNGEADLGGAKPAVSLVAVNVDGSRTVIQGVDAGGTSGIGSVQGTFVVPIPPRTTMLLVTTTLRSKDATGAAPVLTIPLADLPTVEKLAAAGEAR